MFALMYSLVLSTKNSQKTAKNQGQGSQKFAKGQGSQKIAKGQGLQKLPKVRVRVRKNCQRSDCRI